MYDLVFLGLVVSFFTLAASGYILALSYRPKGAQPSDRLRVLMERSGDAMPAPEVLEAPPIEDPLRDRVLRPLLDRITAAFLKLLPSGVVRSVQERLDQAGNPANMTATEFLAIRAAFLLGGLLVGMLAVFTLNNHGMGWRGTAMGLLLGFFFVMVPDTGLTRVVEDRRYRIRKALPDCIDLLVVCVEAGIGFDAAVQKVVEKSKGPLSEEFGRVLQEMRIGKLRAQALRDMGKRVNVMEISTFVAAICQADQTGASISLTLSSQATMMRERRSQRVREQAAKLPVKMLFPLVFCIFPATFVVLLGAGIIKLAEAFGG